MSALGPSRSRSTRLDDLPQEVLQRIFKHIPEKEWVLSLPLVCKAFSRALQSPDLRDFESLPYGRLLNFSQPNWVHAASLCNWLRRRIAGLRSFTCPVDTLQLQDDGCLIPPLLLLLPVSLQHLNLQCNMWDSIHSSPLRGGAEVLPGFYARQDIVPHLSALTHLSNLQRLAVPLHTPLDAASLNSLAALKSLESLQLVWRPSQNQHGLPGLPASNGMSQLVTLTDLSLSGFHALGISRVAVLPRLRTLNVSACHGLRLCGLEEAKSLQSMTLSCMAITEPASVILHALHGLSQLTKLTLEGLHRGTATGEVQLASLMELPSLEHLAVTECSAFSYDTHSESRHLSTYLTSLRIDVESAQSAGLLSGLAHASLKRLALWVPGQVSSYTVPSCLSSLLALEELTVRTAYPDGPKQLIDITSLGTLGPAIRNVFLMGPMRLLATHSLVRLADQPMIEFVCLGMIGAQHGVDVHGNTWLHLAALLQALSHRPFRGLSAAQAMPNLRHY